MFHEHLGWFTYQVGCQLYEPFPLIRTAACWSGAGILLSSDTSDNLLLFVIVEGPKTGLLAVPSFPKACDFSDPSPLRNGRLLNAGVWAISIHMFWKDPLNDQAVNWSHLWYLYQFPQMLCKFPTPATAEYCLTMIHSWPVRSHHTMIPVIACIICGEYWLSAASCQPNGPPSEASCAESFLIMSKPFGLLHYLQHCLDVGCTLDQ